MKQNMPTTLALLFALIAPLAQAVETAPHVYTHIAEQPKDLGEREIAGLFDRWNSALQTGNSSTVASLYAPDAVLQPTVSNKLRTSPAEIRNYFDHFLALKPVGQINYRQIRRLSEQTAVDSGVYTFALTETNGKVRRVQARYTFLYERIGGEWKILNHHSSAMPETQPQL